MKVIRPFAYLREKACRDFAKDCKLPIINENCPACFEAPKERARMKSLLAQEESMVPALFSNIKKSLQPLMAERVYETMNEICAQLEENQQSKSNDGSSKRRRIENVEEEDLF